MRWESFPWHQLKCRLMFKGITFLYWTHQPLQANDWLYWEETATTGASVYPENFQLHLEEESAFPSSFKLPLCPLQLFSRETIARFRLTPKKKRSRPKMPSLSGLPQQDDTVTSCCRAARRTGFTRTRMYLLSPVHLCCWTPKWLRQR